jgi:hypothetical protein
MLTQHKDNPIGSEGVIKVAEALKSNSSLTTLYLYSNNLDASFNSHWITDANIDSEGAIKLSTALKLNTSLTSLDIVCNRLIASFHSHSIQGIQLVVKERSNYLKHSNLIHHSLHSSSTVMKLLDFILTQYR